MLESGSMHTGPEAMRHGAQDMKGSKKRFRYGDVLHADQDLVREQVRRDTDAILRQIEQVGKL